jgi:hypothetical protein
MNCINEIVNVNSFYFDNGRKFRSYPRQIEFGNTRLTFQDGLQYVIKQGQHAFKLFDMTDGKTTFRLRQEGDTWTLLGTR